MVGAFHVLIIDIVFVVICQSYWSNFFLDFPRVLLTISCFRKKFSGIFSEKEILGSKNVTFCHMISVISVDLFSHLIIWLCLSLTNG